jgi:hypothetical protein
MQQRSGFALRGERRDFVTAIGMRKDVGGTRRKRIYAQFLWT